MCFLLYACCIIAPSRPLSPNLVPICFPFSALWNCQKSSLRLLALTETWRTSRPPSPHDIATDLSDRSHGRLCLRNWAYFQVLYGPCQLLPTHSSHCFPTFEVHSLRLYSALHIAVIRHVPGPLAIFPSDFDAWFACCFSNLVPW